MKNFLLPIFTIAAFTLHSCQTQTAQPEVIEPGSDFALLQEKVFTPSCAVSGCHDTQNAVGGLNLTAGKAYTSLVGIAPSNSNAKADGMLRVKAADPYKSFLYVKLDSANLHKSDGYGSVMPLGSRAISAGQLAFIKFWIAGGAKTTGNTADARLLEDSRSQNETIALPPPAQGIQLRTPIFGVSPLFEREINFAVQNTQDVYVTKFEMLQRDRSHHFAIYGYDTRKSPIVPRAGMMRDLYDATGKYLDKSTEEISDRFYVMGSQLKSETVEFPPGMAMRIPAKWLLDLNSHYVNGTRDTSRGEVVVNLHSTTPDKVRTIVKPLGIGYVNLSLPPKRETIVESIFRVPTTPSRATPSDDEAPTGTFPNQDTVHIIGLTSHTHRLGKKFVIQIVGGKRDGEVIYTATNWLNPPLINFREPIVLKRGEGLKSTVTFYNDTDKPVLWGYRSTEEMNFIFGYCY